MFCPLCNAEYRDGFMQCNDCKVTLVATLEDATARNVQAWKGDQESDLDRILSALANGSIPYHYNEGISPIPLVKFSSVPLRPRFAFEVRVLREDLDRAQSAIWDYDRDADDESKDVTATGSMFCPLCKAEYRPGFMKCSDCHATLLTTKSEAQQFAVITLWRGKSKRGFEDVLSVLQRADIPLRFKEHVKVQPTFQFAVFGINLFPRRSTFENEFEVLVLAADAARARFALQHSEVTSEEPDRLTR